MKIAIALAAIAGIALAVPSLAQDQKPAPQGPQADQGTKGGMMDGNMMARMNKMMDQCEKMMGSEMRKGMRRHRDG